MEHSEFLIEFNLCGLRLALPDDAPDNSVPGVVYLHGGFSFSMPDFDDAQPFLDAGFALMTPMLRAENGNPGSFEMFLGEVEDAAAAVQWLASQPTVDSDRVYVFGHSIGGGISGLLTLRTGAPMVHTGGSGGLYDDNLFEGWREITPFDYRNNDERSIRLLLGNQRWMRKPHLAYLGKADAFASSKRAAAKEAAGFESKLVVKEIPGDHFSSLPGAIEAYIELIEAY